MMDVSSLSTSACAPPINSTTFSKGFVFQQGNENSQGAADAQTEAASRYGKSAASAVVKSAATRQPLSGGAANAGGVSRGASLLTRVLSGSKHWKGSASK